MTCLLVSLNKPTALKDNLVACAMVFPDGPTEMDTTVASVTSSLAEALREPTVAVMVVVPGAKPCARPWMPILATVVSDEVQETFPLTL